MTLRDKLKTTVSINTDGEAGRFANRCTEIADNYAIEFLDAIKEYEKENGSSICYDERSSKELLEIFKKEKGL